MPGARVLLAVLAAAVTLSSQTVERAIGMSRLPLNVLGDQKRIWTLPVQVARGRHLAPVAAFAVGMTALLATDARTAGYWRNTTAYQGFNDSFNGTATAVGTAIPPAALLLVGLARKDAYATHTALLAAEAVADSEILTEVLKDVGRRKRPAAFDNGQKLTHSWFESGGSHLGNAGSFPSGHTIAAFSVATVFARRYGKRYRWAPYVAYGLAATVGFSRITRSSHFPSDVFAGAFFGYSISRYAVLRQ